ncbi:peptidoglycan-binding domain-containing protein [Gloeocapsa sp. BRSZ]
MWCRWSTTIAAITFGVTAGLVSYEMTSVAQQRYYYTPGEFRVTLRGLGYDIPEEGPLTDEATRNAIRDFQQRYGLAVDGVAGPQTQSTAAELIRNLHGSLNLVVEPVPPLPRNQFYTTLTESAVEQFQERYNLQTTGIANLETRIRLDQEARRVLSGEEPAPAPSPSPSPSPTPTTSPSPTPTVSPSPSPTPTTSPSPTPTVSPFPSPTPTVSPFPSPTPTVSPFPSPTPTTSPSPFTSPTPTTSPSPIPTISPSPSPTP